MELGELSSVDGHADHGNVMLYEVQELPLAGPCNGGRLLRLSAVITVGWAQPNVVCDGCDWRIPDDTGADAKGGCCCLEGAPVGKTSEIDRGELPCWLDLSHILVPVQGVVAQTLLL